jgi:hypothetical protein
MAIVLDGPILPRDLIEFVRQVPLPAELGDGLSQLLPDKTVDTNRVDMANYTKTGRVARFRMFDGPIHVAQRDTVSVSQVKLPPLSDSLSMGELERLQIEFARTGGTNTDQFINAIYNDAETLTQNTRRRMVLAKGDVLNDGKFTMLSSEGLLEADFGLPAGNSVTAATLWSDTTNADPVSDITAWVQSYTTTLGNGFRPASMTTSLRVLNYLLSNVKIRLLYSTLAGTPSRLTPAAVNSVLTDYGLPAIEPVYDAQVDVDGTATRVTPDNKVFFTPPDPVNNLGFTAWGLTATGLELVSSTEADLSFENAPGIVGVVVKDGPPFRQYTFVDAVGMPLLTNPRALLVATVA